MGERVTPTEASQKRLVPVIDFLVPEQVLMRMYTPKGPIFAPGERVNVTDFTYRANRSPQELDTYIRNLQGTKKLSQGEGLIPDISVREGSAAEQAAGVNLLARLVQEDPRLIKLINAEDSQDSSIANPQRPTRKQARQLVFDFLDRQTVSQAEDTADTPSEMSTVEVISSLWERQKEIARPDDPVDVRLDRMAILKLSEAILNDEVVYIPAASSELFGALMLGDLEPDTPYTRKDIRDKLSLGEAKIQVGLDAMRQVGIVKTGEKSVVGSAVWNEHTFTDKYIEVTEDHAEIAQNDLKPGDDLLVKLREDLLARDTNGVEEAYKRAAAAHLLDSAIENHLFDSTEGNNSTYTSQFMQGAHSEELAAIFTRIENGEVDTSRNYTSGILQKQFPDILTADGRAANVVNILRSVGILKYDKPSRLKRAQDAASDMPFVVEEFVRGENENTDKISKTEIIINSLLDDGERDPVVFASVAQISKEDAKKILRQTDPRRQVIEPQTQGDMREGDTITLPGGERVKLVSRRTKDGPELFVHSVVDGIPVTVPLKKFAS